MKLVSEKNNTTTVFRGIYVILSALLLVIAYLYRLIFIAGCVICTILFGIIQIQLISMSHKNEAYQKKKCKLIGHILLLPSFLMIANGIGLVYLPDTRQYHKL